MTGPSLRDLDGHDPYELLGIPPTATRAEIVAAHRQQVQLVHPDRPGGSEYETKLLHIAKAVLLDPQRRAEYDRAKARRADDPVSEWDREDPDLDAPDDPPSSLWESEEVTTGVAPPRRQDDPPTWDDEPHRWDDAPPRWDTTQPRWEDPPATHWQQPPPWQPPPWQPPPPPQKSVSALPIVALVFSILCWCGPVGLVLGLAGLANPKRPNDRAISITAIVIGALWTMFFLSRLLDSASYP